MESVILTDPVCLIGFIIALALSIFSLVKKTRAVSAVSVIIFVLTATYSLLNGADLYETGRMNFNSWQFLLFLPAVVMLYWALPHKARWAMLLIASYIFYMSWNAWLIVLIMITTVTAYGFAIGIEKTQNVRLKKLFLAITIIICLGLLVFFKYINFILESAVGVIRLFNAEQDDIVLNIILPVGISFYTFQTLSYVIDVYRGDFRAEKHFGYFALYVAYFPQLVAGPIERPQNARGR